MHTCARDGEQGRKCRIEEEKEEEERVKANDMAPLLAPQCTAAFTLKPGDLKRVNLCAPCWQQSCCCWCCSPDCQWALVEDTLCSLFLIQSWANINESTNATTATESLNHWRQHCAPEHCGEFKRRRRLKGTGCVASRAERHGCLSVSNRVKSHKATQKVHSQNILSQSLDTSTTFCWRTT